MDADGFPTVTKELIEALDQRYPEACAEPGDTTDQLMFYGGKRDLVRWLRRVYDLQNQPNEDEPTEADEGA